MTRTGQYKGGSIISFVIVTVAIAALLIGGIIWLRHRGDTVRQQQASDIAARQDDKTTTGNTSETPVPTNQSGDKKQSEQQGATDVTSTPRQDSQRTQNEGGTTATPTTLPETGPAEAIMAMIIVGVLSYTTARYAVSKRELSRSAVL